MHNNSFITLVKEILGVFYTNEKKQFYLLLLVIFFSSLADVISFSMVIPVIYIINDPSSIGRVKFLQFAYEYFHFESVGQFMLVLLLGLVFVFLIKNLFLLFSVYVQNKFVYTVAADILKKQIVKFYNSDYFDVKNNNSVEYLRALFEAPQGFADVLMMPAIFIFNEVLVMVLILGALMVYKPLVVLLLCITIVPIGYLLISKAKKKLHENSDKRTSVEREAYITTIEGINAYSDIKLFNKEKAFTVYIINVFKRYYDTLVLRNIYILAPRRIIEILIISTICILFIIANFILDVSKGQLILILLAFSTAAYRVLPSLNEIVTNTVRIRTSSYVLDLLKFIKDPVSDAPKQALLTFNSNITLLNVGFGYREDNKMLLKDVKLTINKGEFVVLTGDSGAGKTTIGKILTGFIRPDMGKYLIDNAEVEHISQIRRYIGYVTQDFYLFDKSILENIAIGDKLESIDMKKIEQIVEYTNLKEFIHAQPLGIHQPLGEMGSKLSGGQRQRIAIARALYNEIEFLVLDEATSSLDKDNEEQVIDTIYKISKNKNITVLLITHRVSSVKCFDSIYEIRDGHLLKIT